MTTYLIVRQSDLHQFVRVPRAQDGAAAAAAATGTRRAGANGRGRRRRSAAVDLLPSPDLPVLLLLSARGAGAVRAAERRRAPLGGAPSGEQVVE